MAYQPKSSRKFITGVASAALVASAVAPVAASAAAQSPIVKVYQANNITAYKGQSTKDLKINPSVKGKVKVKYKNGKTAWVAVKWENVSFTKAGSKTVYGTVAGTKIKAKVKVTVKVDSVVYVNNQQNVTVDEGTTHDELVAKLPAKVKVKLASGKTQLNEAKYDLSKVDFDKAGEYKVKVHATHAPEKLDREITVTVKSVDPVVKSVSAINGTKLEVKFNKAVSASSLYNAATGEINSSALSISTTNGAAPVTSTNLKGSLSSDGKTLTITVAGGSEYFDGTYTVEVKANQVKLSDNASVYVNEYKSFITVSDETAPYVTGITYSGSTAVVQLSEAIKDAGTLSLDGVTLTEGTDYKTVVAGDDTITLYNIPAGKVQNLAIVGAQDVAGNVANPINVQLNRATDTVKPTVSVSVSGTKATFQFSEALKDLDATAGTDYATVTLGGTTVKLTAAEQDSSDPTKFVYDFSSSLTGDFLNSTITVSNFKDLSDNVGDSYTTNVSLVKDKTPPKFVSATTKDDLFILKFDEDVASTITKGDITIKYVDSEGVLHPATTLDQLDSVVAESYDANGNGRIDGDEENYLVLKLTDTKGTPVTTDDVASTYVSNGKLKAGTYTVTIGTGKVQDTATVPNVTTAPITFTTTVTGGTVSQKVITANATQVAGTPGQIQVVYNKDMGASALSAANYTLGGSALPAGTTLTFVGSKKTVLITLPAGSITATGSRTLTIGDVKDIDGNVLANGENTKLVAGVLENVAPTASKVTLVDGQNLLVDLSEKVVLPGTVSGVTVKVNGNVVGLDTTTPFALDSTGKQLTIKALSGTAFKLGDTITVEFASTNIVDVAGNAIKDITLAK